MGQQQLLLLVLGIVIVGLAVVVGIQAFSENQKKANQDAITNDVIRIASDAQAWALKPAAFGGGNGKFDGLTFQKLGYITSSTNAGYYENLNAQASDGASGKSGYKMAVTNASGTGVGSVLITGCNQARGNQVASDVTGTGAGAITTTVTTVTTCS